MTRSLVLKLLVLVALVGAVAEGRSASARLDQCEWVTSDLCADVGFCCLGYPTACGGRECRFTGGGDDGCECVNVG